MDLSYSQNLIMTPDFTGFPNLQRVIFQGCSRLYKVDPSIGALDQLTILNLKDCKCLISLPQVINLGFLEIFILSGCSRLEKFSDIGQKMTRLSELYLDGTAIEELPSSIKHLTGLTLLNLQGCKNISAFPIIICSLTSGGGAIPVDVTDSLDFHPSNSYNYCFPPGKIEEWFSHHSRGNSAAIDLPPNLYHDDSWMGIAVCTSFSIHGDPETILNNLVPEISQVLFGNRTNLGFFRHKCRQEIMWLMNLGKFIWISYIPGELIKNDKSEDTHIAASLVTHWPGMTVEKCALRLMYQHDLLQFEQKLEDCNDLISEYGDPVGKFMAGQEENRNDTELDDEVAIGGTVHSNKELEVEMIVRPVRHQADNNRTDSERASWVRKRFDRDAIHDYCFCPSKILEWFSHRSEEPVATIPLPPNLNDNSTWMGLALSASFSVLELSTSILDSQVPYHLICSLETDLGSLERFHTYRPSEYERWKLRRGGCLWLSYIPRSSFPSFLNRCSYIEASIATDCTGLTAQTCGFRLLFEIDENDEVEFDEAKGHYLASVEKHELDEFRQMLRLGAVQVAVARMRQDPVRLAATLIFLWINGFHGRCLAPFCCNLLLWQNYNKNYCSSLTIGYS
ncbi:TMV resistance protein N [Morella rubra]|uniref:TMV resistance protein N n=1 Tax=Morella rubra TaxID=262757 RepID=A0A6A1VG19_9ROSI|nr:TMV resistance protein N [Morella rubra]